jgi:hypothetical protein
VSAAKRPAAKQAKRVSGKTPTQAPRAAARKGAGKAAGTASPQAKTPAAKPPAPKRRDRAQEHTDILHRGLAVGASAMAKAIRDAHKPIKSARAK